MQKEKKKTSVDDRREQSVSHAEDIVHKAASQYFGKGVLAWLKIPGKVCGTEIKEVVNMSYLGNLIYDDGFNAGVKQGLEQGKELGIKQGIMQGHRRGMELGMEWCIITLIRSDIAEGETKDTIFSKLKKLFKLDDERMRHTG